ncbi:alanine--tRNA ligase [Rhodothalassium salexigens]|uniref:alanine--tRNA ligase n=1 Tax=Rhodothalassium salexigens TaxID=1086 RepID=UPI00191272C8|nr:alanine--tRNA ligase [Rhodothalassium salexigens]MBK5921697.1 alanine--tRNA ligase [Rhodothalassium salexigens]
MTNTSSTNHIRRQFLDFFAERGHSIVPSSPLVPMNDPTLLFTNAGMVPFKNVFTGAETRPYSRAVSAQKCVRAGGKHNDLDNVGYTARHHTFFEMLGNFSFGDYFKEQAISHAWDLVHKVFGLPADRLVVTVFHDDDVAYDLWRKISGLPEERIIRIATADNFWSMGATGPCGPCSEIFYDHGPHIAGGPPGSPDEDGDRFVEIWNLVFMQYDQRDADTRVDLPRPSIDTGMGIERIAAVLQGTHDNYDIDLFAKLIAASESVIGVAADGEAAPSHRVIADHLRATSFLIADGVMPSNEGRGYVLRRILRRAVRHAHLLGAQDLVLHRLVPALTAEMGQAYPELVRSEALIAETLRGEEDRFRDTLDRGLKLLDEAVARLDAGAQLPGAVAFKLYDTYGFPLDLTEDALRGQGLGVDRAGFDAAMAEQRAKARAAWAGSGDAADEAVWFDIRDRVGATEFVGYTGETGQGRVDAIVKDGAEVEAAEAGDEVWLVANQTPFYAESGGQMGDTGRIAGTDGSDLGIAVLDTQKRVGALHVHRARVEAGRAAVGDVVSLSVDGARRRALRANHSATHLLHRALRRLLGDHVAQKGSLVAAERLRFDLSHPKAIGADMLAAVEDEVNAYIQQNSPVTTKVMSYDAAVDAGAMALFGEKYGDEVRVVAMGQEPGDDPQRPGDYSVELCGGTHVARTGDIALFKIVDESAVSAGVRRIEALTGEAARRHLLDEEATLREAAARLRVAPAELPERVATLFEERRRLERDLAEAKKALALGGGSGPSAAPAPEDVGGTAFLGRVVEGVNPKDLRGMADEAKRSLGSGVVAFVGRNDGKAALVVGVTDDLKDRVSAVELVRAGAAAVGGKGGGGRPDMAQAGGPDGAAAEQALTAIRDQLAAAGAAAPA